MLLLMNKNYFLIQIYKFNGTIEKHIILLQISYYKQAQCFYRRLVEDILVEYIYTGDLVYNGWSDRTWLVLACSDGHVV